MHDDGWSVRLGRERTSHGETSLLVSGPSAINGIHPVRERERERVILCVAVNRALSQNTRQAMIYHKNCEQQTCMAH